MTHGQNDYPARFSRPALDLTFAETDLVHSLRALGADGDRLILDLTVLIRSLPRAPRRLMSDQERDYRIRSGAYSAEQLDEAEREITGGALQAITISGRVSAAWETVSVETVARFLGLTAEDVGARIGRRELYAVAVAGETRFPTWQLSTRPVRRVIPGLHQVLTNMPDWDPQEIGRFFTTRQEGLIGAGLKTPADWLEDGGDPRAIVEILKSDDYR